MKRDMDLIRLLLLQTEGEEEVEISNYTNEQIKYHQELLIEAGLVNGSITRTHGGSIIFIKRLTWEGHEFLADVKNETVWRETKKTALEKGADMSLSVLSALATKISMDYFGLS